MFAALLKAGVSFAEIDGKTTVALWQKYKALRLVALSCPTLCNPMERSPTPYVHEKLRDLVLWGEQMLGGR